MKRVIIILMLVLSSLVITAKGNLIYNESTHISYSDYVRFACDELGIDSTTIYLSFTDKNIPAFIYKASPNRYIIYINEGLADNLYIILAHEVTHIKQDLDGIDVFNIAITSVSTNSSSYISKEAKELDYQANRSAKEIYKSFRKSRNNR